MTALTVDERQVHLWHAFVPDKPAAPAEGELALLNPRERAQRGRFYFEKDSRRYLTTRLLVRRVLARYAPILPADWSFEPGAHGRPAITNPHPLAQRLRFNLSHTDSLVVLAVTAGREIGVDTESTERTAPLNVADRYFSPAESAALHKLPAHEQAHRFWELWTFKEAYIKARGMGLALPLHRFSFGFEGTEKVGIAFDADFDDSASRWSLWQFRPDARHLVGVCLEKTSVDAVAFIHRELTADDVEIPLSARQTRCSLG